MNDFVANWEDYNAEGLDIKENQMICPQIDDIPESFYDFCGKRSMRIGKVDFEHGKFTRFQKKLRELTRGL